MPTIDKWLRCVSTRNWQCFRFVSNPTCRTICLPVLIALQCGMPKLTRRSAEAREECWHIYYGDVHAGTIAIRIGNPRLEDPWEWHCGFCPGSEPGEQQNGTASTLGPRRF
jgi:hypothetical protein